MSWQATTAVLRHSQSKGSDRLVMLCIANYAGEDGSGAFPSNATLCADSKLTERAVRYIIQRLKGSGELTVEECAGPGGTNKYTISLPFASGRERQKRVTSTVSTASTEGQSLPRQGIAPGGGKTATQGGHGVAPKQSLKEEQSFNKILPAADAAVDHRHAEVRLYFRKYFAQANEIAEDKVPWDGSDGKALQKFLVDHPKWDPAVEVHRCLLNWFRSDVNVAKRGRYVFRVLDQYLREVNEFDRPREFTKEAKQQQTKAAAGGFSIDSRGG